MASRIVPTSRTEDQRTLELFQTHLRDFKNGCAQLSKQSLTTFQGVNSLAVKCEILHIQRDQERLNALKNLTRVREFILKMDQFSEVLNNIIDAEDFLSYVWGVMKFLLQTAFSKLTDSFDSLLQAYEKLGDKMPNLKGLKGLFTEHSGMRRCLSGLYRDILLFHFGAYRCFTQFPEKARKPLFKSSWKDFSHQIECIGDRIEAHSRTIDCGSDLLYSRRPSSAEGEQREGGCHRLHAEDERRLRVDVVNKYLDEDTEKLRGAERAESSRHNEQFKKVLGWFSANESLNEQTHSFCCEQREKYPGTCDWIEKKDNVENWLNSDTPTHSILWLNGSMGAGKTTLASYIIEKCSNGTSVGAPFKTIYFYCKGKEAESSTCLAVFKGLLYQQMANLDADEKYRHLVAYCHDKKESSGSQQLQLKDEGVAKSLLDIFFDIIPRQYIIVDGLDECGGPEIKQCLSALKSAVSKRDKTEPGGLRLLVVSRDKPDIGRALSGEETAANIVTIEPGHNGDAIRMYVRKRIAEFPQELGLTKDMGLRHDIEELTCKRANGMFLFAELVLNNLSTADSKDWLSRESKTPRFPKTLAEAYERILARIQEERPDDRWEKTIEILGWLTCAKRTLRWYEIQAIVSIEYKDGDGTVEFEKNKFIPHVQELCGSLVRIMPGKKVELIHHTAHEHLIKNQYVQQTEVEFNLAILCLRYLTFPCFNKYLQTETRREYASEGFYAFQDYAASKWFVHIATLVKISGNLLTVDVSKAAKFTAVLDDFKHMYQDSIPSNEEVTEAVKTECEKLKGAVFYDHLVHLWNHVSGHEKNPIDERNKISLKEMEEGLEKNRKLIEELMDDARGDEKKTSSLQEYYGLNVYKCPRTRCDYFFEGFKNAKKRDHHIKRHDRPFPCPVADCQMGSAGFSSHKDLDKHIRNYHATALDQPAPFPMLNKKKNNNNARFVCDICEQRFTRKINLTGHTRSHFGERPYECQTCGRRFTRTNDLRRHERLHTRR